MTGSAYLGLDGGGSTSIVRVEDHSGRVLFNRSGGPTNPSVMSPPALRAQFDDLLRDCPEPEVAAVCLAGVGPVSEKRPPIERALRERFGTAVLRLEPDFLAALWCFDAPITACVMSGTGSLVCSRDASGRIATSGGHGFLLGDHGSAFRLGQRVLERYVSDPNSVGDLAPRVEAALDVSGVDAAVSKVYGAVAPPALVARAAPVLIEAATLGYSWACEMLVNEMRPLASTTAEHLVRHSLDVPRPILGLIGGTWTSSTVRQVFRSQLHRCGVTAEAFASPSRQPVQAAVLLAREALL